VIRYYGSLRHSSAVQFFDEKDFDDIKELVSVAELIDNHVRIAETAASTIYAYKGDWIVVDADGDVFVYDDEEFHDLYAEVR